MRLSIERLRWGLLAAALLLIAVIVSLLAYGRYRAVRAWRQIVAHSGATVTHEAHEVTYSQAVGGRTVFTIHAADAMPHGDGKYILRNVELLLYGRSGTRVDRIYGSEFDYDQKNEIARALGEVHMDLQAPAALSAGAHDEHATKPQNNAATQEVAETPQTIHVRTSGLIYMRKMGVASTDQEVEIAYQGFHGYAKGAQFNSDESTVHLLADVRVEAPVRGQSIQLTAVKADLERASDVIRLSQPRVRSGSGSDERDGSASQATLHLRKDGSLQAVEAQGDVAVHEGTTTLHAASLNATMNGSSLLESVDFAGGIRLDDSDPARPMHGTARLLTVSCDRNGAVQTALAQGAVSASAEDRTAGTPLRRQISADRLTATMASERRGGARELASLKATAGAFVRVESRAAARQGHNKGGITTTQLGGDELELTFAQDASANNEPQLLTASGNTRIDQKSPDGAEQTSSGDSLLVHFAGPGSALPKEASAGVQVASAEQSGHVKLLNQTAPNSKGNSEPAEGTAERASFDGAADQVTLTGRPLVRQAGISVSASSIVLSQQSGDAAAHGGVTGSFTQPNATPEAPVTHVAAQDAFLSRAGKTADFRGTDAHPARMWQGASQLAAADLLVDDLHKTLSAHTERTDGRVHGVFAESETGQRPAAAQGRQAVAAKGSDRLVTLSSMKFDYSEETREAVFLGDVHAQTASGQAQGNRAVIFLNAPRKSERAAASALGGSVEKIVLSGGVRISEPGRIATGEQMLYTAANQEFVLTGSPGHLPRITDEKQGNITGGTLLFGAADSTIVVAGEPGAHGQARGRVHTETVVKP